MFQWWDEGEIIYLWSITILFYCVLGDKKVESEKVSTLEIQQRLGRDKPSILARLAPTLEKYVCSGA